MLSLRSLQGKSSLCWRSVIRSIQPSVALDSSANMPVKLQRGSKTLTPRSQHYTTSGPDAKIQFPELPKEWEGKYVKGQMYKLQDSIPKLPVPPLDQTLKKYLAGVQYLVSIEEFEATKRIVAEFGKPGGVGEQLQKKLLERADARESWLLQWWNETAYLGFREPMVVHSNPAVGFPRQPSGDQDTFVRTAARLALAILKWNLIIQNHAVPPDVYRKRPMCMAQYDMYSMCRIPAMPVDTAAKTPIHKSRHIIVMRNGHFYKLDLLYDCPDGTLAVAPPSHIIEQLHGILRAAPESCEHPVGVLTTEHRDNWFKTRQELMQDPVNWSTLEAIETAQGVLSLDKTQSEIQEDLQSASKYWDQHKTMLAKRFLHGNGCQQHSTNRWFDSAIQILVGEDGGAGSNLEHSAADGVCAIAIDLFALDIQKIYDVLSESSPVPSSVLRPFQPLEWNISPQVAKDIEIAKEKIDKLAGDVDMHVITYTEFGKYLPKSFGMSPDGFIQNAILLTYYKMYGRMTPMYESGSTRWYRLGRTDTIRNTTREAHTFIRAMQNPRASAKEKANALQAAVKAHSQATVEALEGQAFDRHLLGLRLIAKENGMELPHIFQDTTYKETLLFRLSTSQVPVGNYDIFLCFGAVVPDGYGVCYNPQEKQVIFSVSSFHSCPETDSLRFLGKLTETMTEMHAVLTASKGLNAKL